MEIFMVQSQKREEIIDITSTIQAALSRQHWETGALLIFCPHTTCAITINEGADPNVKRDLLRFFSEIAPQNHGWKHLEGNSDAHIRSSLLGCSTLAPVEGGRLQLGRWQTIYLCEGDGPRQRQIWLQFLPA